MTTETCLDDGSVRNQYIAAIVVNILSFAHGCTTGWTSPFLPLMSSETDTPLDVPLTTIQSSFVASVVCIGGLVGTPFYGTLADKFGRKVAVLASAVPCALGWLLILTWRTATGIAIARTVAGFGGAGPFMIGPIYCVEIASLRTKGVLGSLMVFTINGGIVAMYFMGAIFSYNMSAAIAFSLPILFFFIMLKMPETPVFLVKQRRDEEAAKAIAWLRRESVDSHVVRRVLAKLKHESDLASGSINEDTSMTKIPSQDNVSPWKFFFTSPPTLRAFSVCFLLLTIQVFTGMFAIVTFANDIFAQAGSNLSPSTNAIIIGLLQLLGSIIASFVIEKTGRKILLTSSYAIVAIGNITIGTYFYAINNGYDVSHLGWIPVTALSFVVCTFAMGVGPIPYILLSEIIMVQGRGVASSIILSWVWIASFIVAHTFQQLVEMLGSHLVFWIYGVCASTGILVTVLLVPETKGRSFESIVAFYTSKNEKKALVIKECEKGELL